MVGVAFAVAVRLVVDASKEQWLVTDGQLVEPVQGRPHNDIAFDEVTGSAHIGDGSAIAE